MAATLINVFTVPADKLDEFVTEWKKTCAHFAQNSSGFVETHLHRNSGTGNQSFQFINIARWTSAEAWRDSHDEYRPTEYDIEGVKGHPAIFEDIVNLEKGKGEASRPIQWANAD